MMAGRSAVMGIRDVSLARRAARVLPLLAALSACACGAAPTAPADEIHGTLEPFAREAVYFVVTDRFVNGDPGNDHRDQGGEHRTFDIPLPPCDGVAGNIGYLGGDFRGLADNLGYIQDMGSARSGSRRWWTTRTRPSPAANRPAAAASSPTAARPDTTATGA